MRVGLVYDPIYLKHDTGQHPENAKRLEAIISYLEQTGIKEQLIPIRPRTASTQELSLVHDEQYISMIQNVAQNGGGSLDPDTVMSSDSYEATLYAAGGVITATEAVMKKEVDSIFALVRPPGHHATHQRAMGFCLFNNIAIATEYALRNYSLQRILIIDFDVHHGNGTQEAFYNNPNVLYISTHEYPFYPGTGSIEETGNGPAKGTTINIPLPAGSGDTEYLKVFQEIIIPATKRFKPQLIMVSAGYDNHWADELALMQVSTTGFTQMAEIIKNLADELCNGRMVFSLEGGYNLTALATSVKATFDVLMNKTTIEDPLGQPTRRNKPPSIDSLTQNIRKIHKLF
ncbi:MAG: histone deacetylase [Dehalococcoidales bacterium]|nr:histone deacetylase [Dehalococcoidales bacterium]